jgi:hypothetical protein
MWPSIVLLKYGIWSFLKKGQYLELKNLRNVAVAVVIVLNT